MSDICKPSAPTREWGYKICYPLDACVWWRDSTKEWVLEIVGEIEDTGFSARHTQPSHILPQDVPGLPTHYAEYQPLLSAGLSPSQAPATGEADTGPPVNPPKE